MTGAGTAADPYVIWDVNDLQDVANGAPYASNAYYELGCDIDASATRTWNWHAGRGVYEGFIPITGFNGSLNGRSHRITGLYENRYASGVAETRYAGLFGWASGCSISHLRLLQVEIINHSIQTEGNYVGALAGRVGTTAQILCVCATGTITSTFSSTAMMPHYPHMVGGLIGWIDGTSTLGVRQSYADVAVVADSLLQCTGWIGGFTGRIGDIFFRAPVVQDCYSRGSVWHDCSDYVYWTGGFVGYMDDGINTERCYSTGLVTHIGLIGTNRAAGGFAAIGVDNPPNSFWDIETSGYGTSHGGAIGLTTVEMKTRAIFTSAGWNFVTVWGIEEVYGYWNDGYPYVLCTISFPTITVVSPNGGENWLAGATYSILWNHTGDVGTHVQIELLHSGVFDEIIAASTPIGPPGGGVYSWTIAADKTPSPLYRVRITLTPAPYNDSSDDDFKIRGPIVPSPAPVVTTLPATGVG